MKIDFALASSSNLAHRRFEIHDVAAMERNAALPTGVSPETTELFAEDLDKETQGIMIDIPENTLCIATLQDFRAATPNPIAQPITSLRFASVIPSTGAVRETSLVGVENIDESIRIQAVYTSADNVPTGTSGAQDVADDAISQMNLLDIDLEGLSEAGYKSFTSNFFAQGATHDGSCHTDVLEGVETSLFFTPASTKEELPTSLSIDFDQATQKFIFNGFKRDQFIFVRVVVDQDPDRDECSAELKYKITRGGQGSTPGASFSIPQTYPFMSAGAAITYHHALFIPIFIGSGMEHHDTIKPTLELTYQADSDIGVDVRDVVFYAHK